MKHDRNVDGLRQNAQKKRKEAFKRTEEAIKQLVSEGRPINFKTVAETAEVSTAFLYKESEIKSRIEYLREQGLRKQKSVPLREKATTASNESKYLALKKRLQEIEAENRGLRSQIEVSYGRQRELADENEKQVREIERLTILLSESQAEIERLKQKLGSSPKSFVEKEIKSKNTENKDSQNKAILLKKYKSLNTEIQLQLEAIGIEPNSTLKNTIKSASIEVVLSAIEALKEAQSKGEVPNPIGFLVKGIKEGWTANKNQAIKTEKDLFTEWYPIAYKKGLVLASQSTSEGIMIYSSKEEWVSFIQMLEEYTLEKLLTLEKE